MRTTTIRLALVAGLALTACGGGDDAAAPDASGTVVGTADTDLGTVLVDGDGMTLYLFDSDPEGGTACTDACAETWPPLEGEASAAGQADAELLGTIERPDGSTQVTYDGHPLYGYAADQEPGDVTGQGVGEVWWVVDASGNAIRDGAPAGTPTGATTTPAEPSAPAY